MGTALLACPTLGSPILPHKTKVVFTSNIQTKSFMKKQVILVLAIYFYPSTKTNLSV
jgi:hypothetical protein